jgi:hypothetical protein
MESEREITTTVARRSEGKGASALAVAAVAAGCGFLGWVALGKGPGSADRAPPVRSAVDASMRRDGGAAEGPEDTGLAGEELAKLYCATCHMLPPPEAATKANWAFTLGLMGHYLGVEDAAFRARYKPEEWREMLDARRVPARPLIARSAYERLRAYYIEAAPERFEPRAPRSRADAAFFTAVEAAYRPEQGATTLVRIDPRRRRALLGDAAARLLVTMDARGRTIATASALGSPVDVALGGDDYLVTNIGILWTTNQRFGSIARVPAAPSQEPPETVVRELYRPTGGALADLDGDGVDEIVSSQFGNHLGQLSVFRREGSTWQEHVVRVQPGAVHSEIADLDRDGRPDIVTVFAQAEESVHVFWNEGDLRFRDEVVIRNLSSFGSSNVRLADMDGDGALDVVLTAGDNGDLPEVTLKPYHGVRVYRNDGANRFREAFFYPMYGAYNAMAADFDGDGRRDLAVVAYFPDWSAPDVESFTILRQTANMQFTPMRVPSLPLGRYAVMDVGDIDGDGDADVLLGGLYDGLGIASGARWEEVRKGPRAVLLRNDRKR